MSASKKTSGTEYEVVGIVNPGLESVGVLEVKEILKEKAKARNTVIGFKVNDLLDAGRFCYSCRAFNRIFVLLSKGKIKIAEDVEKIVDKIDFEKWIDKKQSFNVECERVGEHDFNSVSVAQHISKVIASKTNCKASFKSADISFFAYVYDKELFFGIDVSGFDLSKRDYKISPSRESIKGPVGYALIRISDYKNRDFFVDSFSLDGVVCIEAGLFGINKSVNFYRKDKFAIRKWNCFEKFDFDKFFEALDSKIDSGINLKIKGIDNFMGNVAAARKNSKIAGVAKQVDFTRITLDWLDIKHKEKAIDKIVTAMPCFGKSNFDLGKKIYKEFFYQAEYILKDTGIVALLIKSEECEAIAKEFAAEYKFKIKSEHELWQGQQKMKVIVFGKK